MSALQLEHGARAPLRILVASNLYPPYRVGGAEIVASDLAEALAAGGNEVLVVSTEDPEKLGGSDSSEDLINGVRVIRFFPRNLYSIQSLYAKPARPKAGLATRALWHARDGWNTHAGEVLGSIMDRFRPDVLHTHNIDGLSPIVWASARRRGIPVVHTAHDLHLVCPKATLIRRGDAICEDAALPCHLYRAWYGLRAAAVQRFCSPSAFLLEKHREYGVEGERGEVVRNGVPMPWLDRAAKRRPRGPGDPLRVVFMGQLGRHKGLHTILRAIRQGDLTAANLELHVAGAGSMESEVREAACSDPRIRFHGFVRAGAKSELLGSADLFLIGSTYYDNAPLSIVEAYGHGVPVVASRIGGLPEMVRDGETGWLFAPDDHEDLARVLGTVYHRPEVIDGLRPTVRVEAQRYTIAAMHGRYHAIYREEIALARAGRAA
jgi:glycosyltransferase involved in cell wall biosynthesis